jgi:hypothetical protein
MQRVDLDGEPHLFLKICAKIKAGEEIRYDYNFEEAYWRQKTGQFLIYIHRYNQTPGGMQ